MGAKSPGVTRPKGKPKRVARPAVAPEADVLAETMLALSRIRALVMRNNSGALRDAQGRLVRFGMKGSADIIACYQGRFVAVECKQQGKRPSPDQVRYAVAVRNAEGIYVVVRSKEDAEFLASYLVATRPSLL